MEVKVATLSSIANFFNVILFLIGGALTAIGAYLFIVTENIGTAANNELSPIMIVLIVIGSVLIVTALIGFCGVFRKQSLFLAGFLAAMIIVLLAQFAAVVILFTSEASTHYYLSDGMKYSMLFYGKDGENKKYTDAMDYLHERLDCCGQFGFKDFMSMSNASHWYSVHQKSNDADTWVATLPDTCCKEVTENCGNNVINSSTIVNAPNTIWSQGCHDVTQDLLQFWLTLSGCVALAFMFIQVAAVFLNIALQKRYKEHEDYQLQTHKVAVVKEKKEAFQVKQNTYNNTANV